MRNPSTEKKRVQFLTDCLVYALKSGLRSSNQFRQRFTQLPGKGLRASDVVAKVPHDQLWAFLVETQFWNATKEQGDAYRTAQKHTAAFLGRALVHRLIDAKAIASALTVPAIVERLPKAELVRAVEFALDASANGKDFTPKELLGDQAHVVLVRSFPISEIWTQLVAPAFTGVLAPESLVPGAMSRPPAPSRRDPRREPEAVVDPRREPPPRPFAPKSPPAAPPTSSGQPPPLPYNKAAAAAFLRTKTGMTQEVRLSDLMLEGDDEE